MESLLLTPVEAAVVLRISRRKVYELMGAELLRSVKIGRCRRVPVEDLRRYVESLAMRAS